LEPVVREPKVREPTISQPIICGLTVQTAGEYLVVGLCCAGFIGLEDENDGDRGLNSESTPPC
jgi:hypothetical protein